MVAKQLEHEILANNFHRVPEFLEELECLVAEVGVFAAEFSNH